MYYALTSNIETLRERNLEAKSREISVAVSLDDILNKVEKPIFYPQRFGMLYDPNNEYKPNKNGQRIGNDLIEEYFMQLPKARDEYKKLLETLETSFKGGSGKNSDELKELLNQIKQKNDRIEEQAKRIEELSKNAKSSGNDKQVDQLAEMIKTLKELQSNRIEIRMNDKTKVIEGKVLHERFQDILGLLAEGQAVYMYGPAGTGKSELAKQIAEVLELDFYPASTITQEFKLTGYEDGNGRYHETNFYRAMKRGGLFFLDEMDSCSSDVLVGINGCLANGYFDFPHETVFAHKDFRVVSAGNTIGRGGNSEYTGRQALDLSTLDRFWGVPLNYDDRIDLAVAKNDKDLVEFAHSVRKASKDSGISILMSYRSISRIANFTHMFSLVEIMRMAVTKGMDSDDIEMLIRNMEINKTNKYYKAFKEAN